MSNRAARRKQGRKGGQPGRVSPAPARRAAAPRDLPPRRVGGAPEDVRARDVERLKYFQQRIWFSEVEMLALVEGLRRQGVTWAEVGKALGVSRQAAQQRFGPGSPLARQRDARPRR